MSSVRSDWRRFRPAQPEEEPVEWEPKATTTESETLLQKPEEPGVLAVALAPPNLSVAGPPVPAVADSRVFIPFVDRTVREAVAAPVAEPPQIIPTLDPAVAEPVAEGPPAIDALEDLPAAVVDLAPPRSTALVREPETDSLEPLAVIAPASPAPEAQAEPDAASDSVADPIDEIEVVAISPDAEDVPAPEAVATPEPTEERPVATAEETVAGAAAPSSLAGSDLIEETSVAPEEASEVAAVEESPADATPIEAAAAGEIGNAAGVEVPATDPEPLIAVDQDPIAAEPDCSEAEVQPAIAVAATPESEEVPDAPAGASPVESGITVAALGWAINEASPAAEEAIEADVPPAPAVVLESTPGKAASAVAGGRSVAEAATSGTEAAVATVVSIAPSSGPTRGKRQHKPYTSAHRTERGAPCPVCGGAAWMTVSPTLERCPRCSVLRLDPGAEIVQPMETQDLVLLRRVEAYRRESRERVLAVMNASHVSTGDLAELSLTPEQLAEMRVDGRPHIFGSFGMCVLPFALEQSREPVELLRSVHDMLVPGGRLLVASFDPLSLRSLMFGARWSGLRLPGQVFSFRRQHVERMLREAGFEKPRVERVSGCLRAAKPAQDSGSKFEMLALWRTIQNWGAASMFDAAKA